jgi:hypothetical protein
LGRGERKRKRKRYLVGNPRTPVGSLSIAGGWDWVKVREREIRPETHTRRLDLSLSQVVGVREREIRPETHAHQPDLSLSPVIRPKQCHGGADGFFLLDGVGRGGFSFF